MVFTLSRQPDPEDAGLCVVGLSEIISRISLAVMKRPRHGSLWTAEAHVFTIGNARRIPGERFAKFSLQLKDPRSAHEANPDAEALEAEPK